MPPIYDYECPKCEHKTAISHSMKDCDTVHACPECNTPMNREIKEANYVLKGDGWYRDSYTSTGKHVKS